MNFICSSAAAAVDGTRFLPITSLALYHWATFPLSAGLCRTHAACLTPRTVVRSPVDLCSDSVCNLNAQIPFRVCSVRYQFLHLHRSLDDGGRWGTTDDFTTSFLHFSLFSTALWDLANSRPVHSLMLPSHLLFCLPRLLPPFTAAV